MWVLLKGLKSMEEKLYKNRYFIAFYDKNDFLCHVFNNPKEIACFAGKKEESVNSSISRIMNKKCKDMVVNGEKYRVYFIKERGDRDE